MKRTIALTLAVMLLAGMLSCAPAVAENVTITCMASQDWVQDAEIELGERFTEETGIKIDYQIVPADQYSNLLLTKLNTGECTDLFGSQAGRFDIVTQLNVEKNAVDLSGSDLASRLDPLAAAEVSVDGKIYGQPVQDSSAVWAIACSKKILESLSLGVPTTYAEFKAVCDAILASGVTPMGYIMTIFIAGIMSISPTYYEAADLDGANAWQKFRCITLPMLMPTITVTTVLNVIYGLKVFDTVYALTNGGPGYATEVLYTSVYKEFGMGTTLSSVMFVVMVVVGFFLIKTMTRNEVTES